ncbi:phytanoyl-CoA dioxygenase family protein [Brachybacterium sacelli]|uniref:Ectoine hydroxylase-related dioxygenase (Phytanoyl-CoA dioxygenase family) n=1 Tax=Brachybacterium sacelli TaxID=173364 RepID=A0ABS4WWD6_9MICO|nr:phytanoyl-CoA dioxygenase family protein [Brachybacterium sacelli]MBP2380507.1 ectoine hydroxylase-related dioxygenase (phytanoyl-CoA dioxygenase family) [Brachybacterium sacelli]
MTTQIATETHSDPHQPDLADDFARDGFVILDDAIDAGLVEALKRDAARICRGELGEVDAQPAEVEAATDTEELMRQFLCIHYPHKISEAALEALKAPRIVDVLTQVIGPNVKAMQSMLFIKSEGKPGQAWHQDEYFIPTRDRSLTASWIALDDATIENGCLWVLPGSHRRGILYPDREQFDPAFDCSIEAYDFPWDESDAVPVEIPAGSAIIFNGYLLHRSLQNSGRHGYRRALTNHYMSAESLLPWQGLPEGTHIGKHDFRDIVMVTGDDPYEYKGVSDIARPHSRPDKDGGCDR